MQGRKKKGPPRTVMNGNEMREAGDPALAPVGLRQAKPVRLLISSGRDPVAEEGVGFAVHSVGLAVHDTRILDELKPARDICVEGNEI